MGSHRETKTGARKEKEKDEEEKGDGQELPARRQKQWPWARFPTLNATPKIAVMTSEGERCREVGFGLVSIIHHDLKIRKRLANVSALDRHLKTSSG
mmetsp:Transcript_93641/g.251206  ORF Transcript_93641/g.251206 Transcript_93641/m.251206 type:complete len:97 (-) Transcript_93641:72-362(-)